jgi:Leucine-rich repeat (LRR) protein
MKVRRVYLDLANRGLKSLIPPPSELEEFIRPSFSSGADLEFIYLEALSLAHNHLTVLADGLLQIKHLPLLMELDVSHNQLDALDEGTYTLPFFFIFIVITIT